jgi:hypothetical protein
MMQFGGEIKLVVFTTDAHIQLERTRMVQIFDTYREREAAILSFQKK